MRKGERGEHRLVGKLLKWGNSYGVRLSKRAVEEQGLREGAEIVLEVVAAPGKPIDVSSLTPLFSDGTLSQDHDQAEWA